MSAWLTHRRSMSRLGWAVMHFGALAVSLVGCWPAIAQEGPPEAARAVGHPLAPGIMKLLKQEIADALKQRGIEGQFRQFRGYAAGVLNSTRRAYAGSEVTGNCRLQWYDQLLRDPLRALVETEEFTRRLHEGFSGDVAGWQRALALGREKMDAAPGEAKPPWNPPSTPEEALSAVEQALIEARAGYQAALAPLQPAEVGELARGLHTVFTINTHVGHTINDRGGGRRLCDLLEKIDRSGWFRAAEALAPLASPELWKQLAALGDEGSVTVPGVTGTVVRRVETPVGDILICGRSKNTYALDAMPGVAAVIDVGGPDVYQEGSVSSQRPLLVLIDLEGNDQYRGIKPGIQGAAILGVGMLVDAQGDDTYVAQDVAQGSCLGGVGILVDASGDDYYGAVRRAQGHAIAGLGLLVDRCGNDQYRAAMWDQGFGGPLGLGILDDLEGDDSYYTGGLYPDSYPETPGYEGWGQGIGAGIRGVADGGIGVLLEGAGHDTYQFDYMGHGGGYWLGLGMVRDFAGNDRRLGATEKTFHRGPRAESRFQRFGNGFGCHYALGFCFDDAGDDTYDGTIMGTGFAWDLSVGVLCDFGGNDHYRAKGGGTQGNGAQAGLGVLFDYDGDDTYDGTGQGYASTSISYHPVPTCGGNFSFLVDYGGRDKYGCGARNDSITQRNSGGFLIDRPRRDDATAAVPASTGPSTATPSTR